MNASSNFLVAIGRILVVTCLAAAPGCLWAASQSVVVVDTAFSGIASGVQTAEGILTACHTLIDSGALSVRPVGAPGESLEVLTAERHLDVDVCILDKFQGDARVKTAVIGSTYAVGDEVVVHGVHSVARGRIVNVVRTSTGKSLFKVDSGCVPGDSGGGVFDAEGRVIGVILFTNKQKSVCWAAATDWVHSGRSGVQQRLVGMTAPSLYSDAVVFNQNGWFSGI